MEDYQRGRTPADRARVLAEAAAESRRLDDQAHMPGGSAAVFDRIAHWEDRCEELDVRWDRADRAWRDLQAACGKYPEPGERLEIAAALAKRDLLAAEAARARQQRDAALAELDGWR